MAHTQLWRVVERWRNLQRFPPNQSKLAEALGVQRSAVSDWKSGKTKPTPEHLRSLAALMEPSLGPDTHDMLVVALMQDLGYDIDPKEGIGGQLGLFLATPEGVQCYGQGDYHLAAHDDPADRPDDPED